MKTFKLILTAIIAAPFFIHSAFAQVSAQKPNIIYIYADDMGYAELGCYGQQKIKTPNLDRMARQGMRFTQHYTSTPVCAPARCMLMTGKHGGHSYIRGNYELGGFPDSLEGGQMPLPENTFTIPKMLKQAGYTTGAVGKWGLGMTNTSGDPLKQGFDYFYGYLDQKQSHNFYPSHLWENDKWDPLDNPLINVHLQLDSTKATDKDFDYYIGKDYAGDRMTRKALGFIGKNKNKPFFLYLPYTMPHVSLQAPVDYVNLYKGQFKENPYYGQQGYAASKYPYSTYAAMITFLDAQVGIIMEEIKKLGLDNHTIIMFSSDNGTTFNGGVNHEFFNSTGGLRGLKMDVFEGGLREPFIARWPGKIKPGTTSNLISAQYDMLATFAALTQQKVEHTDGISLLPELLGKTREQQQHEYLYFEYPEKGGQLAIRMGDWKGVKLDVRQHKDKQWMLFDLKKDEFEKNDIASAHADIIAQFEAIVKKEHQHAHIKEWEFIDPKIDVRNIKL
ncbi:N-acetylgalactosamine-6-sulfatase [Pedobacter lusitanus]|uniref:N-acetylgalactosamine-6-sulfatase n=1 Tax=Pedobacter lusitanus TaxID=1503925 RepID=A0A0D0FTL4_9SPHI|nr:arylsulfatase [Pedobacter lusitanus]KIO75789.1 N-acetylgalactosamine-6-sulfatase [Pedobacter lusitanus]